MIVSRFTSQKHLIGCSSEPISSRALIGSEEDVFSCNLLGFRWISSDSLTRVASKPQLEPFLPSIWSEFSIQSHRVQSAHN